MPRKRGKAGKEERSEFYPFQYGGMDMRRESSIAPGKDFQIEGCWIPATPAKPSPAEPQPICTERQEIQSSQANWWETDRFLQQDQLGQASFVEIDGFSTGLSLETRANGVVPSCGSKNYIDVNREFTSWEEDLATKFQFCSDNVGIYDRLSMESSDRFADLLALAHAATATTASANASAQADVNGRTRPFGSIFDPQMEGNRFEKISMNSSLANHDLSLVSKFQSNRNCTPNLAQYGHSIPSRTLFDLNSPPRTIADVVLSRSLSSQFAPVTPDQPKKVEKKQVSDTIAKLCMDERANQARDKKDNEVATKRVEVNELCHDKEQSQLVEDQSQAAVSTQLEENHNPDMGADQDTDLNITAQQKPRRRKHRPKVVIEGQPKRTRKPRTPKPAGPEETPRVKRKYVRKKGLNKPPGTPSAEVTNLTTDPNTIGSAAKSCRRSLNFDCEDESSSCRLASNFDSESQAQNFCTTVQSTLELGQDMEVRVEKTQVVEAYDLTNSVNRTPESYPSMPERQTPGPSTPSKTDPPHDKLMSDAQNACARGKCQIVFLDETHDKEASTQQMMINSNSHSKQRSPNDSNCSSSSCLTKEKQVRGLKRELLYTIDEAELCSINAFGARHNSLQAYQAMIPVNEYNDRTPGVHFPAIYKKKRTDKRHNSATSCTFPSLTAAENPVRKTSAYPQKDAHANPSPPETNCRYSDAQFNAISARTNIAAVSGVQDKQLTFKCMLALGPTESAKKKRSKGPTRVRDFASLIEIVDHRQLPTYPTRGATSGAMQGFEVSHQPHTCMEALFEDIRATMATKKRTKKNSLVSSVPPNTHNHYQFLAKSMGLPLGITWKGIFTVEELVEQFRHLDINVESNQVADQDQNALIPYNMRYQEQNALVLYQRDGTVVPFQGSFNPIKKRRPRPKVDLDDETARVWKLLLQDINSKGINGTDEEKERWWEEERRVFQGRADSFIARMHLVQGDRRFSRWKGSVVDSVVGVFLTQNVSDHLSSSAFMSLAARFPLMSKSNYGPPPEERRIYVKEPEVCVLDPDDTLGWHEEKSNQPACNQSSMTHQDLEYNEEKEAVNSNESFGSSTGGVRSKDNSKCKLLDFSINDLGIYLESAANRSAAQIPGTGASFMEDQVELDEVVSSHTSVVSSQNSVDSSIAQTAERIGSCSQSNSEAELIAGSKPNSFGCPTSFVELLRMAGTTMLHGNYNQGSENVLSSKKIGHDLQGMTCDYSQEIPDSGVPEVECFGMLGEEIRFSDIPKKNEENCSSEQSGLSAESANQATVQKIMNVNSQEATKAFSENKQPCNNLQAELNKIFQFQRTVEDPKNNIKTRENSGNVQQVLRVQNFSREALDVTESTSIIDSSRKSEHKAVGSNLNDHANLLHKSLNGMNTDTSKAKRVRSGKEKEHAVDWDSLRKQAQANGKRERTASSMDSMDWEAIRTADVNEIANAIRERGMNNMLAERIKDFLNRIVREHGSIDLEWLRDVPPDKAKEYLLSIRGLGLKSVECVRLLTLHHLAFPVDTNVGRIAVRLGWVPLQPLPESLQLHLLELYPVLESIQKYLWPRLCKLDQRTLYELHYQMITFGKVFCTKSKPNCNACPMRGECRHFASAFASARLALPAPEEKSIVSTIENKASDQSPMGFINQLQLPPPLANQLEGKSVVSNSEPIIEVPATPEPLIEVPATPEPIIEVPATPEPERTQISESDIEDTFFEDPEEIPTIKLNIEEFTQNLQKYMQQNMELREDDMSKALVALTPDAALIPTPKLKNVNRLRTEHQVYELPDTHPLLEGLDKREPDDPCSYLLAIWTPGETADSIQPPEGKCSYQESGGLCVEKTCFSCNSIREANSHTVRGTLLIPCRTAMRGSFPLNGTYFQVNEVFADHESSLKPIDVPRAWIWNLPRRTVFFGTSIPTIFKGLSTEGIQYCFWRGFVCVRGFDQKTRAPRPLMARLHFPASKLAKAKGKTDEN